MAAANGVDKTILYLTDNALNPFIADRCMELLDEASCGCPIVSVSQKPLDFGKNICVGDIGRSGVSIYTQLIEGLKIINTKWVMIAEHDCLYSREHVEWIPPDDEYFWYNDNVWLLQYKNPKYPQYDGMFSHMKNRRVQSQLVCDRDRLMDATCDLLAILSTPEWFALCPTGRIGEPGTANFKKTMRLANRSGVKHLKGDIKNYIVGYQARDFKTKTPNIDIRHESNFTGQRRGNRRRFSLDPWGSMEDILGTRR